MKTPNSKLQTPEKGAYCDTTSIAETYCGRVILAPLQGARKQRLQPGVSSQAPQPPANFWQPLRVAFRCECQNAPQIRSNLQTRGRPTDGWFWKFFWSLEFGAY